MQIKKSVIVEQITAKLEAARKQMEQEKKRYAASWPRYKARLLKYDAKWTAALKKANSFEEWKQVKGQLPEYPHAVEPYQHIQAEQIVKYKRQLRILNAIEGDVIETAEVRPGANLTLESLFY